MDVSLWQLMASVVIPGLCINRLVRLSGFALSRFRPAYATSSLKFIPSVIGFASIPLIVHPIDTGVTHAMNWMRPAVRNTVFQTVCPSVSEVPANQHLYVVLQDEEGNPNKANQTPPPSSSPPACPKLPTHKE
jgi:hypothetical protein